MISLYGCLIVGLILVLSSECGIVTIPDGEKYVGKLMASFAKSVEDVGVSGSAFPILDLAVDLNETVNGFILKGDIKYHDGYLANIGAINPPTLLPHKVTNESATITFDYALKDMHIFFDADVNLNEVKEIVNFEFWYQTVVFQGEVEKDHKTNEITVNSNFGTAYSALDIGVRAYPFDERIQIAAKRFKSSHHDKLTESLRKWDLKRFLEKAAKEVEFPEVCYNC